MLLILGITLLQTKPHKYSLMSLLAATEFGNYATAAAASQRSDLALNYECLSLEIALFAKDGVDIMLKYTWLEEPSGMVNKTVLAQQKKEETH
ncbi:hypothetical protein JOC86_000219 [Bacillus pakistanensis]|uniref:Uncharacterized protein n=2 Tax=Rossellomorea pakistanensis TaxID=992288 RepID=A0ABS2N757_9BACI|nr:hypothetical protein [Bacillus pakistanensis]